MQTAAAASVGSVEEMPVMNDGKAADNEHRYANPQKQ